MIPLPGELSYAGVTMAVPKIAFRRRNKHIQIQERGFVCGISIFAKNKEKLLFSSQVQ
jgi:hypothetical protein